MLLKILHSGSSYSAPKIFCNTTTEPPIAQVNCKYQWMWLAGFVCPTSGETYWWIVPLLTHQVFNQILEEFATHFNLGERKRVVLVLDQAAFHTSEKVKVPQGIDLVFLPAKSPELQPAERLWSLTNEVIANRSLANLDELESLTSHRCRVLLKRCDLIRGLTNFHWWEEAVS
ncbi:transposase [Phormidium tenue FACHB-886]|nr:transposase [Phormidium tenue FACHB-886]